MAHQESTIAAISTPLAAGGLGVLRLSGERSREIAASVFSSVSGRDLRGVKGYTALFGHVHDEQGEFDEAVATVFRAPHSYTGEDVVEISCHGGLYILQRLLRELLRLGAAAAGPGEFTKRAFLNGKLSLTQAESVMDLISAQGEQAARSAYAVHEGALFERIKGISDRLLETAAHLSAWVDYPEEEIPQMTEIELQDQLRDALGRLKQLIATFDVGRVIREGVETAIVGRPNVGKSTLMNLLAGCQKSIVTNVPGTTRDIVEETVNLDGALLRLADTAGLRETEDLVESFGVEKARKKLESAGLVLAVFDSSDDLNKDDLELLELLKGRPAVAVINKTDLPRKIDRLVIESAIPHVAEISAGTGQGAEQIADRIKEVLGLHSLDQNAVLLANERQRDCAVRARQGLEEALAALTARFTFDAVNVCLDEAIGALLELTGQRAGEAVVNQVFARFCVGK